MTDYTAKHEILQWYDANRRDLPWRAKHNEVADPYRVWLSEIMLQQTTVATVKSYFQEFTLRWPTIHDLANAPIDDVLSAWAGLGYYARARNLHACAQKVVTEHGGKMPETVTELKKLPGVGDYTSAAISSIAYGQAATVVDGNVERIISRIFRVQETLPKAKKAIFELTSTLTPTCASERPGDFAQAMMDLGATICRPTSPICENCPWAERCEAYKIGDMETYPKKEPKKPKPTRRIIAFWPIHDDKVLLERREEKGLLGGMAGLFTTPWIEATDFPADWTEHAPLDAKWELTDDFARHTFTHFHLEARIATCDLERLPNTEAGFWHPKEELSHLPTAFKKMAKIADQNNNKEEAIQHKLDLKHQTNNK